MKNKAGFGYFVGVGLLFILVLVVFSLVQTRKPDELKNQEQFKKWYSNQLTLITLLYQTGANLVSTALLFGLSHKWSFMTELIIPANILMLIVQFST